MSRIFLGLLLSFSIHQFADDINSEVKSQLIQLIDSDPATQAFLISHNNEVIHEYYGDGYDETDLATSWSIAKTFYAALIGVAIEQGLIEYNDLQKPLGHFVPELANDSKSAITLYNILAMRTGLEITEYDNEEMFFSKDNLAFAMNVQPKEAQGSNYEYNNVNTMLLSPVIESIFSSEAHDVLINEIFKPIGIEIGRAHV